MLFKSESKIKTIIKIFAFEIKNVKRNLHNSSKLSGIIKRSNEFRFMTVRKDDKSPIECIFCHKRP